MKGKESEVENKRGSKGERSEEIRRGEEKEVRRRGERKEGKGERGNSE